MKDLKVYLVIIAASLTIAACSSSDDDNTTTATREVNLNRNTVSSGMSTYITRTEFPKVSTGTNSTVVCHETSDYGLNYSLEWDNTLKAQRWVCFYWCDSNSKENWKRSNWNSTEWKGDPFQVDPTLAESVRTKLAHYKNSGYGRGHMVASADRLNSKEANMQTFFLSNMHPQNNAFNAGIWEKMERQMRSWNRYSFRDTLFVCKGGTIGNVTINGQSESGILTYTSSKLVVPKYFYMAVVRQKGNLYKGAAFWFEHLDENRSKDDLKNYMISIDELEKRTGIDFFCNLRDDIENSVESSADPADWIW